MDVDYRVRADFIYLNETSHTIQLIAVEPFVLASNEEYIIKIDTEGGKNISADSYAPPFLDGVLIYDNVKCDTLNPGSVVGEGEGPAGIANYESKKN